MAEPTDQWLSVRDAAKALGISEDAIRSKVKRRTLRSRKGNDNRVMVLFADQPTDHWSPIGRPLGDQPTDRPTGASPEAPQKPAGDQESVPLSVHRETIEAVQRASGAALDASQEQIDHMRYDMAQERAETARRIAEVQSMHMDLVGRLQAQAAIERAIWQERVDRAEIMADDANAALRQLVEAALRLPEPAGSVVPGLSWLRRLFGSSTKSKLEK